LEDCLFCRIVSGEIEVELIAERPGAVAFPDINPQAPVHVLIVPRKHVPQVKDLDLEDCEMLSDIFAVINEVAASEGIERAGYRVICNIGKTAGQEVDHLHFHMLGGRSMGWPPG
jgi:histidine triad (HIT) family protein